MYQTTGAEDREGKLEFSPLVEEFGEGDCLPIPIMVWRERFESFRAKPWRPKEGGNGRDR